MKRNKFKFLLPISSVTSIIVPAMVISACNNVSESNQNDDIKNLKKELDDLRGQLNEKIDQITSLNSNIANLNNNISSLESQLADSKREYNDLNSKLNISNDKNKALLEELNNAQNKITLLNNQITSLQNEKQNLQSQLTDQINSFRNLQSENTKLKAEIETLKKKIEELNKENNQNQALLEELNKAQNKITLLNNQITSLQNEKQNLQSQLTDQINSFRNLQSENTKLKAEIEALKKKIEELSKENNNQNQDKPTTKPETSPDQNQKPSEKPDSKPSDENDLGNKTQMFSLIKNPTVKANTQNFDLKSFATVNSSYEAKESDKNVTFPAILTVKGIDLPAFPGTKNTQIVNDITFNDNPPFDKWITNKSFGEEKNYFFTKNTGNWYDTNKWFKGDDPFVIDGKHIGGSERLFGNGGSDSRCCWAAAASNQMMWWIQQNRKYIDEYYKVYPEDIVKLLDGKDIRQSYDGTDYSPFLNYLCEWFNDRSGYSVFADKWMLSGEKDANFDNPIKFEMQEQAKTFKGFFPHLFNTEIANSLIDYKKIAGGINNVNEVFSNYVKDALLNNYAVTFAINPQARYNHAVTLWGAEFDENGIVQYVYYSDSDELNQSMFLRQKIQRMKVLYSEDNRTMKLCYTTDTPSYYEGMPENEYKIYKKKWDKESWVVLSVEKFSLAHDIWQKWYEENLGKKDTGVTISVINGDTFDVSKKGVYKIKYQGTDQFGNTQTQIASITVE
ncbi:IdeS/Mac family cysteine endopeptidase [Mycoplasma sp. VS276A1]